ncbi:MAG: NAD(+) synthase [Tepidanaerobacteraceae bacterium]|jgi:NAD+ synthase
MEIKLLCDKLIYWLKMQVAGAKAKGAVFGISGGIDSAVTSVLCKRAFSEDALGLIMPCYSDEKDEHDAKLVTDKFNIKYIKIDLTSIYDEFMKVVEKGDKLLEANVKPRLRMTVLYYYAAKNNYLVVGSTNKSELTVGYFTKHADSGVDLMPLGNLVKAHVKELAYHLDIPSEIIIKPPSAGLWPNQTDEDEMGISYEELDSYILTGSASSPDADTIIKRLNRNSEHKRRFPLIPCF